MWPTRAVITRALAAIDSGKNQKLIMKTRYKSLWLYTQRSPTWSYKYNLHRYNPVWFAAPFQILPIIPCGLRQRWPRKPMKRFQWDEWWMIVNTDVMTIVNGKVWKKFKATRVQCWCGCDSLKSMIEPEWFAIEYVNMVRPARDIVPAHGCWGCNFS